MARKPRRRSHKLHRATRIKFPAWIRWFMIVTPNAGTGELWSRWRRMAIRRHPIKFFIQDELPTAISRVTRIVKDMVWWVRYRTTDRNHVIKLKSLKPGYYDIDHLMLHATFDLLVEYVEQGRPYRNWEAYRRGFIYKFFPMSLFRVPTGPDAGILSLDTEIEDEDMQANAPEQVKTAILVKKLYLWWTVERKNRIQPYDDNRIWKGIEQSTDFDDIFGGKDMPGEKEARKYAHEASEFYDFQDQQMFEQLVSVRGHLWT